MELGFSIPGKLWWIKNFLSYDMYKGIHNSVIKDRKRIELETSKGTWPKDLIRYSKPPLIKNRVNSVALEQLLTLIKHNAFYQLDEIKSHNFNVHYLEKDAGIDWHNDGGTKYGATYYLNNKWNKNWGGEFMFTDKDGHGWIPPVGNSLMLVKNPLEHKVNPVLTTTVPRISIQIFIK
tara:strand:+ start:323 stop:856 length:534 start_codon:yes stop_codon:yes gene_type:complete